MRLHIGMRPADLDIVFFSGRLIAANYFLVQRNQLRLVLKCIQQKNATTLWQPQAGRYQGPLGFLGGTLVRQFLVQL